METRVQDYLDDKLQSAADLESLDSLLANVKEQHDLLKRQLEEARRDHDEAKTGTQTHLDNVKRKAIDFSKEQEDIDRRLLIVTQSDTSDDAVQKFEASMDRLRKLDVAAEYVELLKEVDTLKTESVSQLGKDDDAALVPYQRLQQLVVSLRPLQAAAEGAAPHLLDHIVANVHDLRRTIQAAFSENLDKTLKKMNWPRSTHRVPLSLEQEWATNVGRLLDLQKRDLEAQENNLVIDTKTDPQSLLPFEVLVHPLYQRFLYHFTGNKPTNRLDKPEYFLNHITDLIANYSDFVQDNLQPHLLKHFRRSDIAFTPAYIDTTSALITALLPMVKDKLSKVASQVSGQPSLLSHLVQEIIRFDNTVKDSYSYAPISPSANWRGLSYYLLDTCGYFEQWLAAEREFALSRYRTIIEASDAGQLDYDSVESEDTKPSRMAVQLNDLLETITERYRYLASFDQRTRFLLEIQLSIFDIFHVRLQNAIDAYSKYTTTIGRVVTGQSRDELKQYQGISGLERVCRIFGSADYLERAMRDWSDDVFFLELWAELDYRSKNPNADSGKLGSTWQDIQQKTSSALGTEDDGGLQGALFDATAEAYRRLRIRSENFLIETLRYDVEQALRPYKAINTWASLSASVAGGSVSAELDPLLAMLNQYFTFLRKALGKAPLRKVGRQVCHAIEQYIWSYTFNSGKSFSTAGATQLTADMRGICATMDRYIGSGQAQIGMRKLLEGVTLVGLPVKGEIAREQPSSAGGDDDMAWEEEAESADTADAKKGLSLFQVERMVFIDNESARHALEQLGLETLTEGEARQILKLRVEISS